MRDASCAAVSPTSIRPRANVTRTLSLSSRRTLKTVPNTRTLVEPAVTTKGRYTAEDTSKSACPACKSTLRLRKCQRTSTSLPLSRRSSLSSSSTIERRSPMAVTKRSVLYAGFSQAKTPMDTATISAAPTAFADLRGFGLGGTGKCFFSASRYRSSASSTGACSAL
ncbi:hypothetical protein D3C76_1313510 [compost metagenome]